MLHYRFPSCFGQQGLSGPLVALFLVDLSNPESPCPNT